MPANLTPDYLAAERRFREARTPEEKLQALEEMLRAVPKHKGTEKLQADIKGRIARLRRQPAGRGARRANPYNFPREGAGQVALLGVTNSGKSSLVASLTKATPEVGAYPFTTREPVLGMMPFEDVAVQLVDLPPLAEHHLEPWVLDIARRADLVWLVAGGDDPAGQAEEARGILASRRIELLPCGAAGPEASVGAPARRALVVVTGLDRVDTADNAEFLREQWGPSWTVAAVSPLTGEGLAELAAKTYRALRVVRVYTKQPGKPADREKPFILPVGATVGDLAARIHKDIVAGLRFARVWGSGAFEGQAVQREHALAEGDVVELHA